jgi:hypothetical protein
MAASLTAVRDKTGAVLLQALVWIFSKALQQRGKFYSRMIILSNVFCFLEVWRKLTGDKPVDLESPLYHEINETIDFYLSKSSNSRDRIPILEREILPFNYMKWVLRDAHKGKEKKFHDFVCGHHLAGMMTKHINLRNYINCRAAEELAPFESAINEMPIASYWKSRFSPAQLPKPVQRRRRPRFILSYLRKQIKQAKRDIASSNYLKIDFSTTDLTALITLSGAILLLLGYCRVAILNWWFGVPYQRYYAISDYITNSVNSISQYLVAATIVAIYWGFYLATINAYSLQSAAVKASALGGRINNWIIHLLGVSSFVALATVFIKEGKIDAVSLEIALAYLGMPIIGYVSAKFFLTPYRAFLFLSLFFTAFVTGLAGVLLEIERVAAPSAGPPMRVLKFPDAEYTEPEWAVLGFTSDFIILRRRYDGLIQVLSKSDLKRIDNVPRDKMLGNEKSTNTP